MKEQTKNFIEYIKNFQVVRKLDDDDLTIMKKYYKNRINACYAYLKTLGSFKTGYSLQEDYDAVFKLSKQLEKEYLNWKARYDENH